jgi:NADH-quinone oxidoreductase subunit H
MDPVLIDLIVSFVKSAVVVGVMLGFVAYAVLAERKVSAFIQERVGPNRVGFAFLGNFGSWIGLGQPVADGLKFLLKEEFTPAHVNKLYFWLAPAFAVIPALVTVCAIPFGSVLDLSAIGIDYVVRCVIADVSVGVLLIFAVTSLSVYGIVLAGWASNSKYPFLGGIRSSAQLISYELAMGLAVIPVFLVAGNLNLPDLIQHQAERGWFVLPFVGKNPNATSWLLWIPMGISFIIFLVAAFAETNRLPFDMPESETELVGGYHTEYSSMKFALFFLGEYAAMIVASSLMVTLFLGGWTFPGILGFGAIPDGTAGLFWGLVNIGVFVAKLAAFIFLFIWVRWTLPRFRYDQLMALGWKTFLPLALANVVLTAVLLLFVK